MERTLQKQAIENMKALLLSCVQHSARQRIHIRPSKDLEVMPFVDRKTEAQRT